MEFGKDASDTISVLKTVCMAMAPPVRSSDTWKKLQSHGVKGRWPECRQRSEDSRPWSSHGSERQTSEWRQLNRNRLSDMQKLANDLAVDGSPHRFGSHHYKLFGSELIGDERFELFELYTEIREVREQLRGQMRRIPSVWELVSAVVQRAMNDSPQVPRLAALNRAYARLNDASQKKSFSSGATAC